MTEKIKILDKYINESETILKQNNPLAIQEQIIKIKSELGFDENFDSEYGMLLMKHYKSLDDNDRQILTSLINRMKNNRGELVDEDNKRQNDYLLDKKRNRITKICAIINMIGVVVAAIISAVLGWWFRNS